MILVNGIESQSVTASDRGLAYGDGVFRTLLVRGGVPQEWHRQYRKLSHDCTALDLQCPPRTLLETEIVRLAEHAGHAVLKIIVTRGEGERGYRYNRAGPVTRVLTTAALPPHGEANSSAGVRVHRCRLRLAHQPALAGIKHLNRLENVLARAEWHDASIAEGILCDACGSVIGGTMTNVFAVFGAELATPGLERCGVAGVTRDRVMEAARQRGVACRVRNITWEELMTADELFLVNSVAGVWPVRQIEERTWQPGHVTRRVQQWLGP